MRKWLFFEIDRTFIHGSYLRSMNVFTYAGRIGNYSVIPLILPTCRLNVINGMMKSFPISINIPVINFGDMASTLTGVISRLSLGDKFLLI